MSREYWGDNPGTLEEAHIQIAKLRKSLTLYQNIVSMVLSLAAGLGIIIFSALESTGYFLFW